MLGASETRDSMIVSEKGSLTEYDVFLEATNFPDGNDRVKYIRKYKQYNIHNISGRNSLFVGSNPTQANAL